MATIIKRGNRWLARVRKRGIDRAMSFARKGDAVAWAAQIEAEIDAHRIGKLPDRTVADMLRRWRDEVSPMRDGGQLEITRIASWLGDGARDPEPLVLLRAQDVRPAHIAEWRDRRLKEVSPATVLREWNLLSAIFSKAIKEWSWLHTHPMRGVARPDAPPPRTRRPTPDEIERLIYSAGYQRDGKITTLTQQALVAWLLSIETAMRAGEILALRWADVDLNRRIAHVRAEERGARKTRQPRVVPLSLEAVRLLRQMQEVTDSAGNVFSLNKQRLDALWRKLCRHAAVDDLHFHDARAEALTRLSRVLDVMQLARVSGHRDLKILLNTYYR